MSSPTEAPSPLGTRDCRTCKRRRIRCDRSLPGCFKCSSRNLVCPGYGANLRWANGIAVRGRYKGMNAPQLVKAGHHEPSDENPSPSSSEGPAIKAHDATSLAGMHLSQAIGLVSNFPDPDTVNRLLDHYDKNIAGLMVWLDSEHNEYRCLVLPLARQHPPLLFAILAIAAEHLAITSNTESNFSKSACDAAVAMITREVQQVTQHLAEGQDLKSGLGAQTAEWMLASMLTLSNYEMVGPEWTAAQSHREAARTLVNALATVDRRDNRLYTFLRTQLSIYDILACTTTFDATSTGEVILPEPGLTGVLFSEFLRLLHQMTLTSREIFQQSMSMIGLALRDWSPKTIRAKFELARGSTLQASGMLRIAQDIVRRDFIRLVDIYHHAAVLYSYRCLYSYDTNHPDVAYSTSSLFDRLDELENVNANLHNLPWPLFIAGTECHGQPLRQKSVVALYNLVMGETGFNHYHTCLQFLSELWAGNEKNWLIKARDWENRGHRILAV